MTASKRLLIGAAVAVSGIVASEFACAQPATAPKPFEVTACVGEADNPQAKFPNMVTQVVTRGEGRGLPLIQTFVGCPPVQYRQWCDFAHAHPDAEVVAAKAACEKFNGTYVKERRTGATGGGNCGYFTMIAVCVNRK